MPKHLLLTALFGFTLTSVAMAESKAPKVDPKPPAGDKLDTKKMASTPPEQLASIAKFYVGSWHCEGKVTPAPGVGKTFNSKSNSTWALTLDGFWLAATSEGEKVPEMPLPTVAKSEVRITYDRTTKSFVSMGVTNRGGHFAATSKGWEGDKLMWTGNVSGLIKTKTRSTLTKKSDTEYHTLGERMEGGKWVTSADETCKKK